MAGATQISQNRYIQSGNEAGNFNYQGLPPEEAVAQRALARKQQIANLLMTQGLEQAGGNNGQMVGRFYVPGSPLQNLAGLGQILAGALSSHHLDKQGEKLQNDQAEMRAQALQDYIQKTNAQEVPEHALPQGSPEVPASPGNLSKVIGDAHPAMGTPQMRQAPTGMANRLFPSAPAEKPPVDYQPPTEAQAAVPATKGPVNPAMTMQPNPMVAKVAQAQLATSTDPYLRQYAMAEAQRQAQGAEHGLQREFLTAQNTENRQNRLDVAQQGFGKDMVLATMMGANKDQLAQMQQAHEKSLENLRGANRKDVAQIGADSRVDVAGKTVSRTPPGYRTTQDGNLEAIPGGPADAKLQNTFNQDQGMLTSTITGLDQLATTANQLLNHKGLAGITGLSGRVPNIPGSSAADAESLLDKLKSQVSFDVLQNMRNNSKTGGALGNVSDAEGKRLENNLAALSKAQSLKQFKSELGKIVEFTDTSKTNMYNSFNLKHKGSANERAIESPRSGGPAVGTVDGGYRFRGGDPGKSENWEKVP